MNSRIKRTAISGLTVVLSYWCYSLIAVPFLQPTVKLRETGAAPPPATRRPIAEGVLRAGTWEVEQPKVLETPQGVLLFDDYAPLGTDRMRLNRCTLISYLVPGKDGDPGRPIVLRAPGGAVLNFDSKLDVTRGQFGQLQGGRLSGEITIESPPSKPGADDALYLVTRNVQISPEKIWTPHEVQFRYGLSHGSGKDLAIHLHEKKAGSKQPNGRVKLLVLSQVDRVEMHLAEELDAPGSKKTAVADADGARIEVTCRGAFRFDFESSTATLEQQVDVLHHPADGPSDQLNCELLQIEFSSSVASGQQSKSTKDNQDRSIKPRKLIAIGYPVLLRSAAHSVVARAERMEYELQTNRVRMTDQKQVVIQSPQQNLVAPEIIYAFEKANQLGDLWAAGPGTLKGIDQNQRAFEVVWKGTVTIEPAGSMKLLTMNQVPKIEVEDTGKLAAKRLQVYLLERDPETQQGQAKMLVDRVIATGQVQLDSPRLAGELEKVDLRLSYASPLEKPDAKAATGMQSPKATRPGLSSPLSPSGESPSKLKIRAQQLSAKLLHGTETVVESMHVTGQVQVREMPGGNTQVAIDGDEFVLQGGHTEHAVAVLRGQPARASVQGMSLIGPDIEIRQRENTLSIAEAGRLVLPATKRGETKAPPIQIEWQGGMRFDGRIAHFEKEVSVLGSQRNEKGVTSQFSARGHVLDVTLNRRLDLTRPDAKEKIEARQVRFDGWVYLESTQLGKTGQQQGFDQMQIRNLQLDQHTGQLHGLGPGWVVHRGFTSAFRNPQTPASGAGQQDRQLTYLRVDFESEMVGNINAEEVSFVDQIRCLYGPIDHWQQALKLGPNRALGEREVLLNCQRLTVAQMELGPQNSTLELQAMGNARINGQAFEGLGHRMTYNQGKDQLILEGDGRADARLKFQKAAASAPVELSVGKILFYPSTKQFSLQGIRSFEIPNLQELRTGRAGRPRGR